MSDKQNLPDPDSDAQIVLSLMDGFRASKAVFTAVSLGVFDQLHQLPSTCDELANRLNCNAGALERILGACTGLQLLQRRGERYHNLPAATRFLRIESPETLSGYMLYSDRVSFRLWRHLEDAVREGSHRWEQEFGFTEGIFDHLFATEKDKKMFLSGMHGHGLLSSPAAVSAFDLSRFGQLTDLGGATGHLAIAACRRYPALRATVFDLATVTPVTRSYVEHAGLQARIDVQSGDFFTDPLPAAGLYSTGRILHDWSDDKVRFLLHKICEHLPLGGGLLICEKLLNEERDGPVSAYLQSLNMLLCTEGKERSPSEYESLTRAAGFSSFEFRRTGQPVDVMLALK
jgi:acetylserotonin O-methyltransferase